MACEDRIVSVTTSHIHLRRHLVFSSVRVTEGWYMVETCRGNMWWWVP